VEGGGRNSSEIKFPRGIYAHILLLLLLLLLLRLLLLARV